MKKKLVVFLLIFTLGFSVPFYASRGAAYIIKEFTLDLIARLLARSVLDGLTNGIIGQVLTMATGNFLEGEGKPGQPSFVQDWKKFKAEAQRIGENQFRAQLRYVVDNSILCANLKKPLSQVFQPNIVPLLPIGDVKLNASLKQNTLLPFQTKIKCSIPDKTLADFTKDFAKGGGWETWARILEPQNNLAGVLAISMEELNKQRGSQEEALLQEAAAGEGFKPGRKPGSCQGGGQDGSCVFFGKTITPPKLLSEGATKWIDSNLEWLTSSDELSEVLSAILDAAINKLADFTAGKILDGGGNANAGENAPNPQDSINQDLQNINRLVPTTTVPPR